MAIPPPTSGETSNPQTTIVSGTDSGNNCGNNNNTRSTASSFHSAQSVTNIRNQIPLILDLEKVQYHTWAELFQITARGHDVLSHIDGSPCPSDVSETKWKQLDAIVLSWIYGTISDELLITVIQPGSSAREAWLRIKGIFHDNQNARAADLEARFINTHLDSFSSISVYCHHLKSLADQLGDIDSTVTEQRLVLQLINGLSKDYDVVGSIISQMAPLPSFSVARSMLTRDESRRNRTVAEQPQALLAAGAANTGSYNQQRRGRGRGRRFNGVRGGFSGDRSAHDRRSGPATIVQSPWYPPPPNQYWQAGWAAPPAPPCPYPTAPPGFGSAPPSGRSSANRQSSSVSGGYGFLAQDHGYSYSSPSLLGPGPMSYVQQQQPYFSPSESVQQLQPNFNTTSSLRDFLLCCSWIFGLVSASALLSLRLRGRVS